MLGKSVSPILRCSLVSLLVLGACQRSQQQAQDGRDSKVRDRDYQAVKPPGKTDKADTNLRKTEEPKSPPPAAGSDQPSKHDIFIADAFKVLGGDELSKALMKHVLEIPGEDWSGMLEFVRSIPPGEHVEMSFGTAMRRISSEHPELWPDKLDELKGYLTKPQLDQMAEAFGEKLGKSAKGLEVLKATQDHAELPLETRIAFASAFFRNQKELDPAASKDLLFSTKDVGFFAGVIEYAGKSADAEALKGHFLDILGQNEMSQVDQITSAGRFGSYLALREGEPPYDLADKMPLTLGKRLLAEYFYQLGSKDLNTALAEIARMPTGAQKDAVILRVHGMVNDYDPEVAKAWAAEISDPATRKAFGGK